MAGYIFEWDSRKAVSNLKKHGISFDEATTIFGDPLSLLMDDPKHSADEQRFLVIGLSVQHRLLVVAFAERPPYLPDLPLGMKGNNMNKNKPQKAKVNNRDTLQPEYDFSKAVRGVTAKRYAEGTNVVVIPPELRDVFPDSATVAEALRALAPVIRHQRQLNVKAA